MFFIRPFNQLTHEKDELLDNGKIQLNTNSFHIQLGLRPLRYSTYAIFLTNVIKPFLVNAVINHENTHRVYVLRYKSSQLSFTTQA